MLDEGRDFRGLKAGGETAAADGYLSEAMGVVNGLVGADVAGKVLVDERIQNITELYSSVGTVPKAAPSLGVSIFTFLLPSMASRIRAARRRMVVLQMMVVLTRQQHCS